MFAKIVLSMIIIISSASIGYVLAYRYVQRLQDLKNLYLSFQLLETEVLYSSNPLPTAMLRVSLKSNKTIGKIFMDTYELLNSRTGYGIEDAWQRAVDDNISHTSLLSEDREILMDFVKNLGATDKENQIKNFHLVYLQLKKQQEIAEGLKIKNEKMCKSLGVIIGIAIVIVFI